MRNVRVSAAFYELLPMPEMRRRNAMHGKLVKRYDPAWCGNVGLDKGALHRLEDARSKLALSGDGNDPSRIAAAPSFGLTAVGIDLQ